MNTMSRETVLRTYLNEVKRQYDYILVDCSPSLGMLTLNALTAADRVIIPVQSFCASKRLRTATPHGKQGAAPVERQI